MAVPDRFWFQLALLVTVLVHLGAVVPVSRWIEQIVPPRIAGEGIEIDLTEWRPQAIPPTAAEAVRPAPEPPESVPDIPESIATVEPLSVPDPEETPVPSPEPEPTPAEPAVIALPPEPEAPPIFPEPDPTPAEPAVIALPPEPEAPPIFPEPEPFMPPVEKKPLSPEVAADRIVDAQTSIEPSAPDPDLREKPTAPVEPVQPAPVAAEPGITVVSVDPSGVSDQGEPSAAAPMAVPGGEDDPPSAAEETTAARSPLFLEKPPSPPTEAPDRSGEAADDGIPEEIKQTFRRDQPEETANDHLQYSLNTYQWTFERYIENWVVDLQRWWKAPLDYLMGRVPEGGDVWIQVDLDLDGSLLGYRVFESGVSTEMELRVIQALIGSLNRPALPASFPADRLIINWRFVYPPLRPALDLRR